ncbi:MAG: phosphoribosylanthranilate isomerase [Coriobacteriia bacterium]|nr:phosphoribosylanthranilate isomerase [Coriobacteriia bacterium]MBN2822990.1 phosphoribosylanthranilate isomerase [Coriobacteriia bacterium]
MHRTRIKICGITNAADAAMAVCAGADALGFVLAPSSREVTLEEAEKALVAVPPMVARVGVFVDADRGFVSEAVSRLGLSAVQFHGDETPEDCAAAPVPAIKALKVGTNFASGMVEPFRGAAAAILLDTYSSQSSGGTGKAFDWHTHVAALPGWASLIVAGGLTPVNVADAVRLFRPFAVDVSSGVEERPGHKDRTRIDAFVAAVRAADEEDQDV